MRGGLVLLGILATTVTSSALGPVLAPSAAMEVGSPVTLFLIAPVGQDHRTIMAAFEEAGMSSGTNIDISTDPVRESREASLSGCLPVPVPPIPTAAWARSLMDASRAGINACTAPTV